MTLEAVSVLFVLGVLAHNAEEAIFLPRWSRRTGAWHRPVGSLQFGFAVAAFSALLLLAALLAFAGGPHSIGAYLLCGFAFAMAVNALVPHLAATVVERRYMPGTATGLAFNLPLGVWLLRQAIAESWAEVETLLWAAPLVGLLLMGLIPVLLAAGARFAASRRANDRAA